MIKFDQKSYWVIALITMTGGFLLLMGIWWLLFGLTGLFGVAFPVYWVELALWMFLPLSLGWASLRRKAEIRVRLQGDPEAMRDELKSFLTGANFRIAERQEFWELTEAKRYRPVQWVTRLQLVEAEKRDGAEAGESDLILRGPLYHLETLSPLLEKRLGLDSTAISLTVEDIRKAFGGLAILALIIALVDLRPWPVTRLAMSPDGRSVAITSQQARLSQVYVIPLDDSPSRWLSQGDLPVWSPDGQRVGFFAGADLCWMYKEGVQRHYSLDSSSQIFLDYPAWDPQSRWLAAPVAVSPAETASITESTAVSYTLPCAPAWSPDRSRVAFLQDFEAENRRELRVLNLADLSDGTGDPLTRSQLLVGFGDCPTWSPDGQQVVFFSRVAPNGERRDGLYAVNVADRQVQLRTAISGLDSLTVRRAVVTPDLQQFVFIADRSRQGRDDEVFIANADGSGLRCLKRFALNDRLSSESWKWAGAGIDWLFDLPDRLPVFVGRLFRGLGWLMEQFSMLLGGLMDSFEKEIHREDSLFYPSRLYWGRCGIFTYYAAATIPSTPGRPTMSSVAWRPTQPGAVHVTPVLAGL